MKNSTVDWRRHITLQEKSGVSVSRYCKGQGLVKAQMYYWQKKMAQPGKEAKPAGAPLIPVVMTRPSPSLRGIGVKLPNGIQLVLDDGVDLSRLGTVVSFLMEVGA